MDFVELFGRTGFFSFFNGVTDLEIEFVLVLVAFLLEAMRRVKLELFDLFRMGVESAVSAWERLRSAKELSNMDFIEASRL